MHGLSKGLLRSCSVVLRAASWIVPRSQRSDWLRERRAEVWHWVHFLAESGRLNSETQREVVRHCWGSFADALWCRFNRTTVLAFLKSFPATPRFCLLCIVVPLFVLLIARPWPLLATFRSNNTSAMLIAALDRNSHWLEPELLRDSAADWVKADRSIASAETYAWRPSVISGPAGKQFLVSARITPGVLQLLDAQFSLGQSFDHTSDAACTNCVILSHAVWNEQFHGDTQLSREFVFLNGRQVRVVGVLSDRFRFPDTDIQAFIPFDGAVRRMPGLEWSGVLLRLANASDVGSAKRRIEKEVDQTRFPWPATLNVSSLNDIRYRAVAAWCLMGALASLVVIGVNWRTFRQLCTTSPKRSLGIHLKWWAFFTVKSGLLAALAWLASVDLVQAFVERAGLSAVRFAGGAAIWVFVVTLFLAMGWCIRDQNARCRFCLKRLRTEIVLGEAKSALLEPSGCDLFCESAHGMLHVPAMQLSSLDFERWIDFDDSWQILAHDA